MFTCRTFLFFVSFFLVAVFPSCKNKHPADKPQIVEAPEKMDEHVSENIKDVLQYALENSGKINDSVRLLATPFVDSFYEKNNYKNVWSKSELWDNLSDSLLAFIENCNQYGLFPSDYHFSHLVNLKSRIAHDSIAKKDATLWTQADIIFTDAFMQIAKHLKFGRMLPDSISLFGKDLYTYNFFVKKLNLVFEKKYVTPLFNSLEPENVGYVEIKKVLKSFVEM